MMANDLGHDFPGLGTTAKRNKKKDFMVREGRTTDGTGQREWRAYAKRL